jgi:hypothetical protein
VKGSYASGLAVGEDAIYALAGCLALDAADGHVLWQQRDVTSGICAAPTLADGRVYSAAGRTLGSLSVYDLRGMLLTMLDDVAERACDGVIVVGVRAYTVGGNRVLALGCSPRGEAPSAGDTPGAKG